MPLISDISNSVITHLSIVSHDTITDQINLRGVKILIPEGKSTLWHRLLTNKGPAALPRAPKPRILV